MIRVSRRAARAGLRAGDSSSPPARTLLDSSFTSFEHPRGAAFQLSLTLLAALSDSGPYPALGGWHLPHSRYTLKQRYCTSTRAGPTGLSPCVAGPSRPLAPAAMHTRNSLGPGSSPFARRYSGNRLCFLLLGLLICLSSARLLARHRADRSHPHGAATRPAVPTLRRCTARGVPPSHSKSDDSHRAEARRHQSRSVLRSSSTPEPSDPLLSVEPLFSLLLLAPRDTPRVQK